MTRDGKRGTRGERGGQNGKGATDEEHGDTGVRGERRWCSRKAIGGGDGSVEQKGCGGCGKGGTPMEENGGVAAAG